MAVLQKGVVMKKIFLVSNTRIAMFGIALLGATVLGTAVLAHNSGGDVSSHTFFSVRPHFQAGSPEKETFFRDFHLRTCDQTDWHTLCEVVAFGGKSTESRDLGRFFLPFGKNSLIVSEYKPDVPSSTSDTNPSKDIEALHFNIETNLSASTTFQSEIQCKPEQKFWGIGFDLKQVVWRHKDRRPLLWLEVSFPLERITNNMHLTEHIFTDGGGAYNVIGLDGHKRVGSMTEAFVQDTWNYGRMDNKDHSKFGVADIEIKCSSNALHTPCCNFDWYLGFVIPTGTKINRCAAKYVFSPVVGNNHHWGLLGGAYLNYELWKHDDNRLCMEYDYVGGYLFKNHQIRSFDLKGKPWGRYMELYNSFNAAYTTNEDSGTSGINVFTKPVIVKPKLYATFNAALTYAHHNHGLAEIGYNLYVRNAEKVALTSPWTESVVLKSVDGSGDISLARTIKNHFKRSDAQTTIGDGRATYAQYEIQQSNLDLTSAAHPAIMSNTVYGSLGYQWNIKQHPFFIGLGGGYEFSSINTIINRWTLWGKLALSL